MMAPAPGSRSARAPVAERSDAAEVAALFDELRATGSRDARDELVNRHAGLAVFFARRYRDRGVDTDDLRQVAMIGLINAVDRFDPDHGAQFSSFAGRTIDGELKRHFRDKSWAVRVPRRTQELVIETRNAIAELSHTLGRSPSIPEIAAHIDADDDEVIEALDAGDAFRPQSLDAGTPNSGSERAGDSLPARTVAEDERGFDDVDNTVVARELLESLPDREREIVERRFVSRQSQSEIADALGISQMHVSRLLRQSLAVLRSQLEEA